MLTDSILLKQCGMAFALICWSSVAQAQSSGSQRNAQQPPPTQPAIERSAPNVLVSPLEDYRLSPGDTIEIQVEDAPELASATRITAAGDFEMPFLGAIKAQGKTTRELARIIAAGLREQDYLKQPQVTVAIKQYYSQTFFIHGSVRSPGVYQVEGRPSLIRLISLAGGLADNHGSTAIILRPGGKASAGETVGEGETQEVAGKPEANPQAASPSVGRNPQSEENEAYELIKVNINAIYDGSFEQNLRIEPGDIVNIPIANVFFVAGEVNAPGSFQLKEGTTLRQAISLAQGTTFKAALGRGVIFRDTAQGGKREEVRVDIADVMSGKKEDVAIFPNDVIIVPNSRTKSISSALLMALGVNSARIPVRY